MIYINATTLMLTANFYNVEFLATLGLLFVLLLNIVLGFFVFLKQPSGRIHQLFLALSFSLTAWSSTILLLNTLKTVWAARLTFASGMFIGWSFFFFTLYFPKPLHASRLKRLTHHALALVFFIISFTPFIIRDIKALPVGFQGIHGPFFVPYDLVLGYFFIRGFIHLLSHLKTAIADERRSIFLFLLGWSIMVIFGFSTNLILPLFGIFGGVRTGPFFTFLTVLFTVYAISKHQMFHIKVIITEMFVAGLLLAVFTDIFSSVSFYEYSFRISLFVFVFISSLFLVKSVRKEVHQREQLEVLTTQLEVANKELARLDQAKSEFLSIASHQLRTPLTAIKGYSSMLLDGTFGPLVGKVRDGVGKVFESTERMVMLVNDLLDTSRLESGRMQFHFVETDVGEIVKSVCDEIMPRAREKQLTIACTLPPVRLPKVYTDQMKIRQVIMNFIDNAIKYTEAAMGTIAVGLAIKGEELVFSVKDNGWGMTSEEMGFLFKKFSRGRGETSHIKGTGLGLYVARRLAEAHGGRVWAESAGKGKGSTFFLVLKVHWRPSSDGVYIPKDE